MNTSAHKSRVRSWFALASIWAAIFISPSFCPAAELPLHVRETRGLRRHSFFTSVLVELPAGVPRATGFRLTLEGRPLTAQVRPASVRDVVTRWWVDFLIDLGPGESRTCVLRYGPDVSAAPESATGHVLEQAGDVFTITNAPHMKWTVPRDLQRLLRSVRVGSDEQLHGNGPGLTVVDRRGVEHPLAGSDVKSEVLRSGTLAVGLRFRGSIDGGDLGDARFVVDLIFPSRVSWTDITCQLDDPRDQVAAIAAGMNFAVAPPSPAAPTLVDLGATTLVYSTLQNGERARLESRESKPHWRVLRGPAEKMVVVAAESPAAGMTQQPEGWAHVMDRNRCLAVAVEDFGQPASEDSLDVASDGSVKIVRRFAPPTREAQKQIKRLRTWWHFVRFPPQQGAATSPQMMQSPLEVRVGGGN